MYSFLAAFDEPSSLYNPTFWKPRLIIFSGRDYSHTLAMQKFLKNTLKSFDVILIITKGTETRYKMAKARYECKTLIKPADHVI